MATKQARKGAVKGRVVAKSKVCLLAVAQTFDNKAGHYELIRVEGNTAHYTFTNHQGHQTDATMAVMTWRRLQERVHVQPEPGLSAPVLGCLAVVLALASALPGASQAASANAPAGAVSEITPTRVFTLPGAPPSSTEPQGNQPPKNTPESNASKITAQLVAASQVLSTSSGDPNAEAHYRTAVLAVKADDLAVAAEEMNEAAQAAPENALVLYGLAVIQARNHQPEQALPSMEKALRLGLPGPESARAPDLVASIRYAIKKNEAEQKKVTPLKLWGTYDAALDQAAQEFEDRAGRTLFKLRTPLSREMVLWKVDGETAVRGHWLEKNTLSEEFIFADARKHDPKPRTTTEEHWWLVTILINQDGSLDGSRMETCTREAGFGCENPDLKRGKVITFKGHVEPNGDLTISQTGSDQSLTLRKTSRVASTPPPDVHIDLD
jgi:hypothetical protein